MPSNDFCSQLLSLQSSLEKFAFSLTLQREGAKDLVQETCLKALSNQDKYIINDNFKAWIFTIMKNTFINDYRRNFRVKIYHDLDIIDHFKFYGSDEPDSVYLHKEMTQNIEQLNDKFRIPFKMHFNGYKYKEIADVLNLNIGTVKSRIFFSRKKLMDQLAR
jgi:RNA polymerase sigma-70 factor (ECF subfamily)